MMNLVRLLVVTLVLIGASVFDITGALDDAFVAQASPKWKCSPWRHEVRVCQSMNQGRSAVLAIQHTNRGEGPLQALVDHCQVSVDGKSYFVAVNGLFFINPNQWVTVYSKQWVAQPFLTASATCSGRLYGS
jgi:hypothetical protein